MIAYIFLLIIYIISYFFLKNDKKKLLIFLIAISLIFFGIRNNVGVDDHSYIRTFNYYAGYEKLEPSRVEITFIIISRLLKYVFLSYKSLFMIYSVLSFYFLYKIMKKVLEKETSISIFIVFLTFFATALIPNITIMRQFLCSVIIIHACLVFSSSEKKTKDLLSLLLAFLISYYFHHSVYLFLPFAIYLCFNYRLSPNSEIVLVVLSFIIGQTQIINNLLKILVPYIGGNYSVYVRTFNNESFINTGIVVLIFALIYVFKIKFLKYDDNKIMNVLEKGEFLYYITTFSTFNSGYLQRISYFFIIFRIFWFVTLTHRINLGFEYKKLYIRLQYQKYKNIINYLIIVFLMILCIKNILNGIGSNSSIFSNDFSIFGFLRGEK